MYIFCTFWTLLAKPAGLGPGSWQSQLCSHLPPPLRLGGLKAPTSFDNTFLGRRFITESLSKGGVGHPLIPQAAPNSPGSFKNAAALSWSSKATNQELGWGWGCRALIGYDAQLPHLTFISLAFCNPPSGCCPAALVLNPPALPLARTGPPSRASQPGAGAATEEPAGMSGGVYGGGRARVGMCLLSWGEWLGFQLGPPPLPPPQVSACQPILLGDSAVPGSMPAPSQWQVHSSTKR